MPSTWNRNCTRCIASDIWSCFRLKLPTRYILYVIYTYVHNTIIENQMIYAKLCLIYTFSVLRTYHLEFEGIHIIVLRKCPYIPRPALYTHTHTHTMLTKPLTDVLQTLEMYCNKCTCGKGLCAVPRYKTILYSTYYTVSKFNKLLLWCRHYSRCFPHHTHWQATIEW